MSDKREVAIEAVRKPAPCLPRLLAASFGKRRIFRALIPARSVPLGFTMANEIERRSSAQLLQGVRLLVRSFHQGKGLVVENSIDP